MKKIKPEELRFIGILLGIAATFMILFPALSPDGSDATYTGIELVFGHEFASIGEFGSGQIEFSIFNLIAYALPVSASLILIFNAKGFLVSTLLFAAGAIMLVLVPDFTNVSITALGNTSDIDIDWSYGYGLIIAAVLSFMGLALGIFTSLKKA